MKHRLYACLTALLLLAATIFWLVYVPYRPARLLRSVPQSAVFVSRHQHLDQRWDDVAANPLARSLFESAGLIADDDVTVSPSAERWIRQAGRRDLVFAYGPADAPYAGAAWYLAGWLGPRSTLYRWYFHLWRPDGVRKMKTVYGDVIWAVALEDNLQLSLAFLEGLVVAAVSENPVAVEPMVRAAQRWKAAPTRDPFSRQILLQQKNLPPDSGWFQSGLFGAGQFQIQAWTPDRFHAVIRTEEPAFGVSLPGMPQMAAPSAALLERGRPVAEARLAPSSITLMQMIWPRAEWPRLLKMITGSRRDEPVKLRLYDGDFRGRMMGFAVPALVAEVPIHSQPEGQGILNQAVDTLNAVYRTGLIAERLVRQNEVIYVIDTVLPNFYDRLAQTERAACLIRDDRMVISSNLETLKRLMQAPDESKSLNGEELTADPLATMQVDLAQFAKTSRAVFAALTFRMLLQNDSRADQRRKQMETAQAWINMLAEMQMASLELTFEQGRPNLNMVLEKEADEL